MIRLWLFDSLTVHLDLFVFFVSLHTAELIDDNPHGYIARLIAAE